MYTTDIYKTFSSIILDLCVVLVTGYKTQDLNKTKQKSKKKFFLLLYVISYSSQEDKIYYMIGELI